MRTPRRFRVRMVAVVAGALVLAACGAGSGRSGAGTSPATSGKDAGRIVAASADATAAAKSARLSMTFDMSIAGHSGTVTAAGLFDFSGHAGELSMDMSSLGVPGVTTPIEMRMVDGIVYMDMGSLLGASPQERALLGGKHWIEIDPAKSAGSAAPGAGAMGGFGGLGSSNPTSVLDSLRGAGSDVHEVGHDTVRGVETTHYQARLDLTRALDRLPASQRDRAAKLLRGLGTGTIPVDVWIDGDGRPRKLVMHLDTTTQDAHVGSVTMELSDFGTKVDVQAPPADQVVDFQSMVGGLLGHAGTAGGLGS